MNKERYVIWYEIFDDNGVCRGTGMYVKKYKRFGYAERVAKQQFGDSKRFNYYVCSESTNPFDLMKGEKR